MCPESEQDVRHCHGGELGGRESRDGRRNVRIITVCVNLLKKILPLFVLFWGSGVSWSEHRVLHTQGAGEGGDVVQ